MLKFVYLVLWSIIDNRENKLFQPTFVRILMVYEDSFTFRLLSVAEISKIKKFVRNLRARLDESLKISNMLFWGLNYPNSNRPHVLLLK